jgi:hypothetical protein
VVAGGVIGVATACLVLDRTGDPRELFVIATAAFCGLAAGEAGSLFSRVALEGRERWLAAFELPKDAAVASRNLTLYTIGSSLYVALVEALFVLLALPLAVMLTESVTGRLDSASAGAAAWLTALPALAVATIVHAFASRALARFAVVGLVFTVVVTWLL